MMHEEQDERTIAASVAARLWASFTPNEKGMVRFGIFPAEKVREGEQEIAHRDRVRLLAVALMDCAKNDGGMRA